MHKDTNIITFHVPYSIPFLPLRLNISTTYIFFLFFIPNKSPIVLLQVLGIYIYNLRLSYIQRLQSRKKKPSLNSFKKLFVSITLK